MENIQDGYRGGKLYNCLLSLVDITRERQKDFCSIIDFLPKQKAAKEYSTIKLCSCRGSGHTSSIVKIIEEKFNKVILVVPNMRMADMVLRNNPSIKNKVVICTPCNTKVLWGVSKFDAVIFDCTSMISHTKIDEIYELTSYGTEMPLYILME